ncbi:MAG: cytochrome ubiquinol oxidase subunit I [Myxococcales bacterium]|nr:MAG: cytochrome ubiquinol oxidase subunit I [Myxococcales bacterium]
MSIGLGWLIFIMMTKWKNTGSPFWRDTARFWLKLFIVTFGIGVATGLTLEFQFGTNWADYSRFVGDIFGAPLAAEGIFSFFLESTFLGVLIFAWNRASTKTLWFASLMMAVGATLSAFWIIVANSWMQTPAGFEIQGGRAVLTDFWAALFNPTTMVRYLHTTIAAITTGAFFMMGISAWYLLKKRHVQFAAQSLRVALIAAFLTSLVQVGFGHWHGVMIVKLQPEKLAAMEGHFDTTTRAPLKLFGIPDEKNERFIVSIEMPPLLSVLAHGRIDGEVKGLKDFPKEDRPPVTLPFFSFHIMVVIGFSFVFFTAAGMYLLWKKTLPDSPLFLKLAVSAIPAPMLANQLGWITAEVGRQPWAVYHVIRTKDAVSQVVSAGEVLFSLILFGLVYSLLFVVWIHVMRKTIKAGPGEGAKQAKEAAA